MIHEKPLASLSVQDVTERATVNRATFYAHFPDKEALAASVLRSDLHAACARRFSERPPLTVDNLVEFAILVFEFLADLHRHCPRTALALQEAVGSTIQQELYDMFDGWLRASPARHRLFPGVSVETAATALSWSIYGAAYRWTKDRDSRLARDICRELIGLLAARQSPTTTV